MEKDRKLVVGAGTAIGLSGVGSTIGLFCIGPWAFVLLAIDHFRDAETEVTEVSDDA